MHVFRRILFDFPAVEVLMDFPKPSSHGGFFLPWCFEVAVNGRNENWEKCLVFCFFFPSVLLKVIFTSIFCLRKKDQQSVPVPQEGVADIFLNLLETRLTMCDVDERKKYASSCSCVHTWEAGMF